MSEMTSAPFMGSLHGLADRRIVVRDVKPHDCTAAVRWRSLYGPADLV